jgi:hypothetical protein
VISDPNAARSGWIRATRLPTIVPITTASAKPRAARRR